LNYQWRDATKGGIWARPVIDIRVHYVPGAMDPMHLQWQLQAALHEILRALHQEETP
jgi:hypothetical protein